MLLNKPISYTGLLKMLSELMQRVQDFFKPYTLEQFIIDSNPQTTEDVEYLERVWAKYTKNSQFTASY